MALPYPDPDATGNIEFRTRAQLRHPGDCHHGAGFDQLWVQVMVLQRENEELRRMLSHLLTPPNWFRKRRR